MKSAAATKTSDPLTTAKRGNPGEATRGAAVTRATRDLADALDAALRTVGRTANELDEFSLVAHVADTVNPFTAIARATLSQLRDWTARVAAMDPPAVRAALARLGDHAKDETRAA